ncbi:4874_t:CDS:2, partial [Diversispora eburnea]
MSNNQLTINTLRELNSMLASEIIELRKENDDDTKGIDQSSVCEAGYSESNTISTKMKNSNDTP